MSSTSGGDPRRFGAEQHTLFFDPQAEPIAEVADGERIIIETLDSVCGIAKVVLHVVVGPQVGVGGHGVEVGNTSRGGTSVAGSMVCR